MSSCACVIMSVKLNINSSKINLNPQLKYPRFKMLRLACWLLLISFASCDEFVISDSSYGKVRFDLKIPIITSLSDRSEVAPRVQGRFRLHHQGG